MSEQQKIQPKPLNERIEAIDALRGFDMFWITGGLALVLSGAKLITDPLPQWLQYHSTHCAWEGFAAWDLVMPLFLFVVGASMPFAFAKYNSGGNKLQIYLRIIRRVIVLFLLGMVTQGNLLSFHADSLRLFCNTLQAIAGGYLIASIFLLHTKIKGQIIGTIGLLLAYWACINFIPYGDNPAGTIDANNNLALYLDKLLQGTMQDGTDYTWILSQLAFGALTLLGVLAGQILKSPRPQAKKLLLLCSSGILCLILGYTWSLDFPIIKRLFTSSMVLWSAGWCFLLLAFFYLITDICKLHWLSFPFKVIGSNAIFVYMWVEVCSPEGNISRTLFTGFSQHFGDSAQFVFLLLNYAFIWTVLYFLYKKKAFFRV